MEWLSISVSQKSHIRYLIVIPRLSQRSLSLQYLQTVLPQRLQLRLAAPLIALVKPNSILQISQCFMSGFLFSFILSKSKFKGNSDSIFSSFYFLSLSSHDRPLYRLHLLGQSNLYFLVPSQHFEHFIPYSQLLVSFRIWDYILTLQL